METILEEKGSFSFIVRYRKTDRFENLLIPIEAIARVNHILAISGFDERIGALEECSISMFICIFETLFNVKIPGIIR